MKFEFAPGILADEQEPLGQRFKHIGVSRLQVLPDNGGIQLLQDAGHEENAPDFRLLPVQHLAGQVIINMRKCGELLPDSLPLLPGSALDGVTDKLKAGRPAFGFVNDQLKLEALQRIGAGVPKESLDFLSRKSKLPICNFRILALYLIRSVGQGGELLADQHEGNAGRGFPGQEAQDVQNFPNGLDHLNIVEYQV
ncbi:hypothetical protein D3C71_1310840 [compost metagenome]